MNATAVMLNHYDSIGKDDYYTLKGIFEMVDNEELCMSKSSSDRIKLWWNPEKLDDYMNSVDTVTPGCN